MIRAFIRGLLMLNVLTLVQPLWARTGYDFGVDKSKYTCDREVSKFADFSTSFEYYWESTSLRDHEQATIEIRKAKIDADRFYVPNKKWEAQNAANEVNRILAWVYLKNKKEGDTTEFNSYMRDFDFAHEVLNGFKNAHLNSDPNLVQRTLGIAQSQNLNLLYEYALLHTKIEEARRDYMIRNILNCKFKGIRFFISSESPAY